MLICIGLVVDSSCDLPQDFIRQHGHSNLALACSAHGVLLLSSMMSTSGAANVGDGAPGLAYADGEHEFDG